MSDNVKVVEGHSASHNRVANFPDDPDLEAQSSTFLPDYFMEDVAGAGAAPGGVNDDESNHHRRSMYLATLKLNKVRPEQKGVYKCGPSNTRSASVELHITDGNLTY